MTKRAKAAASEAKAEKAEARDKRRESGDRLDVFEIGRIEQLVGLMKENGLSEIDLAQGKFRIQLRRGPSGDAPVYAPIPVPSALPAAAPASIPTAAQGALPAAENDPFIKEITAPMVGTFFSSPSPGKPAFVSVGDGVSPEKTVCILEAMKVFNEIQAELSGRVVAVLAKDGDAIEYGQPLFKIDTRS